MGVYLSLAVSEGVNVRVNGCIACYVDSQTELRAAGASVWLTPPGRQYRLASDPACGTVQYVRSSRATYMYRTRGVVVQGMVGSQITLVHVRRRAHSLLRRRLPTSSAQSVQRHVYILHVTAR